MMDGLFGSSPWEIQQAQLQATNHAADKYATQDPFQRAAGGMYRAGAGLAQPIAGMLGMDNPAIAQAKRTEQIMGSGNGDLTTSKGILAKAEQFRQAGDMRTAVALLMKGKELEKQEMAAALAARKQDFQENQAHDLKVQQLTQQFEIARMRGEDSRNAAADRAAAMREANQIRLQLGQLAVATRASVGGGESKQPIMYVDDKGQVVWGTMAEARGKPAAQYDTDARRSAAMAGAAGKEVGTVAGKAESTLPGAEIIKNNAVNAVNELLAHDAFSSAVGATLRPGARLVEGSPEADFMSRLEQIQGGAFLQAYETLRGGGQITEVEGNKAQQAMNRMSKSQSEAEFKLAAKDFITSVNNGVKKLEAQSRLSNPPRTSSERSGKKTVKFGDL